MGGAIRPPPCGFFILTPIKMEVSAWNFVTFPNFEWQIWKKKIGHLAHLQGRPRDVYPGEVAQENLTFCLMYYKIAIFDPRVIIFLSLSHYVQYNIIDYKYDLLSMDMSENDILGNLKNNDMDGAEME